MTDPAARRFEGKVVLITGAAGGIGRATAVRFATEGARLRLVDRARATGSARPSPRSRKRAARG
jgi:NAD(P)-dependent dehydrogenase (short-subunit alcohol dehydrogenase family)